MAQEVEDAALDRFAHDVLPATRLGVDLLPLQADDVDEEALGEPVLAHDPGGEAAALLGQLQVAVAGDGDEAVPFHARHRLADGGAALVEPLRDAGAHGHHTFLLQFEDGAEIHLRGVDQSGHPCPLML
ncbi:hypothetical protein GA0115252_124046 [Streptomyces sp. DfronAA-171]|nr:hypothetical protein GA0115252_124046 [Streptomyces sp. DfronAA-171]